MSLKIAFIRNWKILAKRAFLKQKLEQIGCEVQSVGWLRDIVACFHERSSNFR